MFYPHQYNLKDFWNSDIMRDVRLKMINGEKISYCKRCYDFEQTGVPSLRQEVNKNYSLEKITGINKLIPDPHLVGAGYSQAYTNDILNVLKPICEENNITISVFVCANDSQEGEKFMNKCITNFSEKNVIK